MARERAYQAAMNVPGYTPVTRADRHMVGAMAAARWRRVRDQAPSPTAYAVRTCLRSCSMTDIVPTRGKWVRIARRVLLVAGLFLLLLPVMAVVLVRYTDGHISNDDLILLGYDERHGRFQLMEPRTYELDGIDGPYVIAGEVITVDGRSRIQRRRLTNDTVHVPIDSVSGFKAVVRHQHPPAPAVHPMPGRLVAISDIEGNFTGLRSFLQAQGIMDADHRWTFGTGHVVFLGDMVDRGDQVLPVLWMIHRLEEQAQAAGGAVHFILGNHEHMALYGDGRYAHDKYRALARALSPEGDDDRLKLARLHAADTELGAWLRSRNAMERIGPWLFVHAGLSGPLLTHDLSLHDINTIVREQLDVLKTARSEHGAFLLGRDGPLWYRGLVKEDDERIRTEDLAALLRRYEAEGMVVGHSVVDDISFDHAGRVLRIDVKHGTDAGSGLTRGALFEGGRVYRLDDRGERTAL